MNINITDDLFTIIEIYYTNHELSASDIKKLFVKPSSSSVAKLKKIAREKMVEENKTEDVFNAHNVLTECAYRAWKIDIADVEKKYERLLRLSKKVSG